MRPLPGLLAAALLAACSDAPAPCPCPCSPDSAAGAAGAPSGAAAASVQGADPASRAGAAPLLPEESAPRVAAVSKGCELSTPGGGWRPARVGERLLEGDALRTAGGPADLSLPGGSTLKLDDRTEVAVRGLGSTGPRLALVRGRATVVPVAGPSRPVRLEGPTGEAAASGAGRWSAVATASSLGVAAAGAPVRLESKAGAVEVPPGSASSAWHGRAPRAPAATAAPLAVASPAAGAQVEPELCAVVRGTADPGDEIQVGGQPVDLAPDGSFSVRVPRAGRVAVDVVARHASGRTDRRTVRCADAALSTFELEWDER